MIQLVILVWCGLQWFKIGHNVRILRRRRWTSEFRNESEPLRQFTNNNHVLTDETTTLWSFTLHLALYRSSITRGRKKIGRHYARNFFHDAIASNGPGLPLYVSFTITLRHTTLGRTPLDEWSAPRRAVYLTTRNIHNRQTPIPSRRHSNPQPYQASCRRPVPSTARPLRSASSIYTY
jgi:hypothetical protein